jgi:hypothetical protein
MSSDSLPDGPYGEYDVGNHPLYRYYGPGKWYRRGRAGWIATNDIYVPREVLRIRAKLVDEG